MLDLGCNGFGVRGVSPRVSSKGLWGSEMEERTGKWTLQHLFYVRFWVWVVGLGHRV